MPVLIRLAFRNMWAHKSKTFIIGTLLCLGVIIIIVGNTMIDSVSTNLKEGYIEFFTGHVMIAAESETAYSVFGMEAMASNDYEFPPAISDYDTVYNTYLNDPRVEALTSIVTSFGIFSLEENDPLEKVDEDDNNMIVFSVLFGVDFNSYLNTFPSINIYEGSIPSPGEGAILLSTDMKKQIEKNYKQTISIGDSLLITGLVGGMRIREVQIAGFYDRGGVPGGEDADNSSPFSIIDVNTARVFAGLTHSDDDFTHITSDQKALLETDDFDSFFVDDFFGDTIFETTDLVSIDTSFDSAVALLGDTSKRDILNQAETGSWHFILLRLKNDLDMYPMIQSINNWAIENDIAIQAKDWKAAAGTAGKMADFLRLFFVIAILIIAVVGVIIIMNTLVISVIERTGEIGTMRALGAKKSFIRAMFLTETLSQSVFFGLIGAGLSVGGLLILNALHIPIKNTFLKLLLGGDIFHLVPSVGIVITTVIIIFLVGWFAHFYPVRFALKIQPIKAMQTE